jgi:hypothetical protein
MMGIYCSRTGPTGTVVHATTPEIAEISGAVRGGGF